MSKPIEDYALIGDCHAAALVARDGAVDWLCLPRFDSAACFAALLGTEEHGRWRIAPAGRIASTIRRYRGPSLILETLFETDDGAVAVVDFMPPRTDESVAHVVRVVEGRRGRVAMQSALRLRFDYGTSIPWVTRLPDENGISAMIGPNLVVLRTATPLVGEDLETRADFDVAEGATVAFVLAFGPSHRPLPPALDANEALAATTAFWDDWAVEGLDVGPYTEMVRRSLTVLKGLTYLPTGGIVAAVTTSLPEKLGGVRNWDYRFCWLRDSVLTLVALMVCGHHEEARGWREWARRAVTGDPQQLRIMYGLAGERRLDEWEADALPGYEGSRPVRIGNAAADQLQLDVFGQLIAMIHFARIGGLADAQSWSFETKVLAHLEKVWREPDCGIWEFRDQPRHFTFSKVMVWTAFDCGVRAIENFGLEGPVERWREIRAEIHDEICAKAFDAKRNAFMQSYGAEVLDASVLFMAMVNFLPADDPRLVGTVAAIERDLCVEGLVLRYRTEEANDGLPPGEGAFLPCSFWLVNVLRKQGRVDDATRLFERLVGLANDVGLLAEEYDVEARRQVGNFPQAFSHVSLINAAVGLVHGLDLAALESRFRQLGSRTDKER